MFCFGRFRKKKKSDQFEEFEQYQTSSCQFEHERSQKTKVMDLPMEMRIKIWSYLDFKTLQVYMYFEIIEFKLPNLVRRFSTMLNYVSKMTIS